MQMMDSRRMPYFPNTNGSMPTGLSYLPPQGRTLPQELIVPSSDDTRELMSMSRYQVPW